MLVVYKLYHAQESSGDLVKMHILSEYCWDRTLSLPFSYALILLLRDWPVGRKAPGGTAYCKY